jgi:hypothetical protein
MIIEFIIFAGPFLTGMMIFMLLEMGVSQAGAQKRLVYLFMDHPWGVEALIQILLLSFPLSLGYIIYQGVIVGLDSSGMSIIILLAVMWPVMGYILHRRLLGFKHTLGIGQKKEYDSIFIAKLSVFGWIASACTFVAGIFSILGDILPEFRFALSAVGSLGMLSISFRKNLAIVRNQDEPSTEEWQLK